MSPSIQIGHRSSSRCGWRCRGGVGCGRQGKEEAGEEGKQQRGMSRWAILAWGRGRVGPHAPAGGRRELELETMEVLRRGRRGRLADELELEAVRSFPSWLPTRWARWSSSLPRAAGLVLRRSTYHLPLVRLHPLSLAPWPGCRGRARGGDMKRWGRWRRLPAAPIEGVEKRGCSCGRTVLGSLFTCLFLVIGLDFLIYDLSKDHNLPGLRKNMNIRIQ